MLTALRALWRTLVITSIWSDVLYRPLAYVLDTLGTRVVSAPDEQHDGRTYLLYVLYEDGVLRIERTHRNDLTVYLADGTIVYQASSGTSEAILLGNVTVCHRGRWLKYLVRLCARADTVRLAEVKAKADDWRAKYAPFDDSAFFARNGKPHPR
jgi:hypothetical protein